MKCVNSIGPRWRKRVLTYRVAKFSSTTLKPKTLQKEIDLAFKYWEREANLTFRKVWVGKVRSKQWLLLHIFLQTSDISLNQCSTFSPL